MIAQTFSRMPNAIWVLVMHTNYSKKSQKETKYAEWFGKNEKKAYFYVRGNLETRWARWAYGSNNDLNLVQRLNSSIVVVVVDGFQLQQLLFLFNNLSHTIWLLSSNNPHKQFSIALRFRFCLDPPCRSESSPYGGRNSYSMCQSSSYPKT